MHTHEEIAVAAFYLWEKNPDSDADSNWYDAEAQLLANTPDNQLLKSPDVVNLAAHSPVVR
jgi:hypothetical protein